ncbi:MAG TPA: glycosyltransferase family 4 protein [Usitatibacter sp.]|nr:glycosyltransferase family 4 protein [Usitatibacter sp.]
MRVAIASVQVPYLAGGAEALAEGLRTAVAARGHPVELVTLPFRFFPPAEVERSMRVWAEEDFTRLNLYEPDRVICLKFPAYGMRHPSKSLWLCHQHRSAYELFDAAGAAPEEHALRERVHAFDREHLAAFAPRCTISRRVSERLARASGLASEPLYHPPPAAGLHYAASPQPFVFFPSRIEHAKRQELVLRAMKEVRAPGFAVFAGEGGQLGPLRELAATLGLEQRVRFVGRVGRDEMLALYASAAAVCFTPLDEDYGYVTLEAMLSSKPVITCSDSGGPLEFVVDGETGHVVAPQPAAVAAAIDAVLSQPHKAALLGRAGRAHYTRLVPDWDVVVAKLLGE